MMEQVRLCALWPMENWLGLSLNQIQGWTTVRESYSCFRGRISGGRERASADESAGVEWIFVLGEMMSCDLHINQSPLAAVCVHVCWLFLLRRFMRL